jgi:hypothetical protein
MDVECRHSGDLLSFRAEDRCVIVCVDAVVRMLNLNHPVISGGTADEEVYKVLVYDNFCRDLLAPLIRVNDLRKHGVTLYLGIDKERQNVPDVPAIYFVQPVQSNVQRIVVDASRGMYEAFHLNFSSSLPRPLLEELATGTLKSLRFMTSILSL